MTPDEAAELLNVVTDANPEEILGKYQEAYSDFQIRLANAPTATLRKTYQRSLNDLRTALVTLLPGNSGETADLPSAQPLQLHRGPSSQRLQNELPANSRTATNVSTRRVLGVIAVFFAIVSGLLLVRQVPLKTSLRYVNSSDSSTLPSESTLASVLVIADLECEWSIDGISQGRLVSGGTDHIRVGLGKHILIAATLDGLDRTRLVVEVSKPQQEVATIELRNIRERRLALQAAAAAESAKLQRDSDSERRRRMGYWIDQGTGLAWPLRDPGEARNWKSAVAACRSSSLGGLSNWHLPDIKQLSSLLDSQSGTHTRGGIYLTDCCMWSSTSDPSDPTSALAFDFPNEVRETDDKDLELRFICVSVAGR